jgi:hypothetical protein
MVSEIAALVLRFATPGDTVAYTHSFAAGVHLGGQPLQRLPSLAAETLPATLTARFAECAQYAPAAYRRELFGAHSELHFFPHASHQHPLMNHSAGRQSGEYSYGVFDGLDVQAYLPSFPAAASAGLSSPPHSPHKHAAAERTSPPKAGNAAGGVGTVEASPGLKYAVPSSAEGEEDEF